MKVKGLQETSLDAEEFCFQSETQPGTEDARKVQWLKETSLDAEKFEKTVVEKESETTMKKLVCNLIEVTKKARYISNQIILSPEHLPAVLGDIDCIFVDLKGVENNDVKGVHSDEMLVNLKKIHSIVLDIKAIIFYMSDSRKVRDNVVKLIYTFSDCLIDFQEPMEGLKSIKNYKILRHRVPFTLVYHRLQLFLDILDRKIDPIYNWTPTKALYMYSYLVNLETNEEKVILEKIECGDGVVEEFELSKEYVAFSKSSLTVDTEESMEHLKWTLQKIDKDNIHECPIAYVIAKCHTVEKLLEVACHFRSRAGKKLFGAASQLNTSTEYKNLSITVHNINYIFLMCIAVMERATELKNRLTVKETLELFNLIFSILDYMMPHVVRLMSIKDHARSIGEDCASLLLLSSMLKVLFSNESEMYNDYVDILYKYIVAFVAPITRNPQHFSFPDYLKVKVEKTVIHRNFIPDDLCDILCFWKLKFEDLTFLHQVMGRSEPNNTCVVCLETFDENYPGEIAILERCDHLCHLSCLTLNVNPHCKGDCNCATPNYFECPHDSCILKQASFVTGEKYEAIREDTLKLFNLEQ